MEKARGSGQKWKDKWQLPIKLGKAERCEGGNGDLEAWLKIQEY